MNKTILIAFLAGSVAQAQINSIICSGSRPDGQKLQITVDLQNSNLEVRDLIQAPHQPPRPSAVAMTYKVVESNISSEKIVLTAYSTRVTGGMTGRISLDLELVQNASKPLFNGQAIIRPGSNRVMPLPSTPVAVSCIAK